MLKASYKVPEGKMVQIEMEEEDGVVSSVSIRGDFFIEPPEKLKELEKAIEGMKLNSEAEEVEKVLGGIDAKLIGFSISDIGKAFRRAVEGEKN